MDIGSSIAGRIKKLCKEKNLSINKLSYLAGLTQSTVDNIIKGNSLNPKLKTIAMISRAFGMNVLEFLNDSEILVALDSAE